MSQQDLNAFADWLVANQSKKGTPEYDTVANAFKELDAQINPPDTSFSSAFQQGLDAPLENMATTARMIGAEGTADTLSGLTTAPENYESAANRFINPQEGDFTIGGFAPGYLPRAAVEQAGQLAGSLATRAGGAALGSTFGPKGTVAGALAGPALFEFVQQLGPIAAERARNNGRAEPEWEDWTAAASAAGLSGALNALGVRGGAGASMLNKTMREGVTEGTQSLVEQTGSTAGTEAGLEVSPRQAIGEAIIGGTTAGGFDAAGRVAGGATRIFTGAGAVTDTEAAADLANRLKSIADANGLDLGDIDKTSTKGAREAVDKAHVQLSEELKQLSKDLRQRLQVTDSDELSVVIDKVLAAAGQREARNKTKNTVGREEFDAIDRLAGSTAEGQRMLRLMRQTNELTELHNSGYQGGLSKYTDQLMPFGTNIGYDRGAIATERLLRPLVSGGAALQTGGASLAGQAAIAGAGRAIDAVTGRRSNVRQFVKNNAGNQGVQIDPTATSLRDDRRAELAAAEQQAAQEEQRRQAARARTQAMHADVLNTNTEYPDGSPQQIMSNELGLSPQQLSRALKTLVNDPIYGPAARAAIRSLRRGGKVPNLGMVIKRLKRTMASKTPPATRDRPIISGQLAAYEAQEIQRSAAIQQGIRDNQALNDQLQAALRDDNTVSESDRVIGLNALQKLRRDLSISPVQTARAIMDDALNRMSDPLVANKYIAPYVDRVIMQQNAKATSEAPTAIEGMSAEPEINQMASAFASETGPVKVKAFHGTYETFSEFDMGRAVDGAHFFTTSRPVAENFGPVSEYEIEMQNPRRISQVQLEDLTPEDGETLPREMLPQIIAQAKAMGHDGLIITDFYDVDQNADTYLPFNASQITPVGPEINQMASTFQGVNDPMRISPRKPTGAKATEDALAEDLQIDAESLLNSPNLGQKVVNIVDQYVGLQRSKLDRGNQTPDQRFIDHVKSNLLHLYNAVSPEYRERAKQWYVGANKLSSEAATRFNLTLPQVSGVMAALSPQKDWYINYDLGVRTIDVFINAQDQVFSPAMAKAMRQMIKAQESVAQRKLLRKRLEAVNGKKLSELTDGIEQAIFVRFYDQANNPERGHRVISPEGDLLDFQRKKDGTKSGIAWNGFRDIAKAISIIQDGSRENISEQLGDMHKVRSFYNNILNPMSDRGDVTIDTHAVAAGMMKPLSGKALEVGHNFNTAGKSAITGAKGTYGLYADAYRQAAAEVGVLPREMQSITWEAIRGLFSPQFKGQQSNVDAIENIWKRYDEGTISIEQAREEIFDVAGNIDNAAWETGSERSDSTVAAEIRRSGDAGELSGASVSRRGDDTGAPGQSTGILYQSPLDFGSGTSGDNGQLGRARGLASSPVAGSREPTPTEIEQASRTVKAAFEIGKPGSQFENGVPDIDAAKKIAEAINVAVVIADTHGKLAGRVGKAINRKISPSRVKQAAGFYVPDKAGPHADKAAIAMNTSLAGPNYQLFTILHELGHAFESRAADPNSKSNKFTLVEEQIYSPNRGKFQDLDAKSKRDLFTDTFRDVMRQVLAVAGGGKADLKMSKQDAQDIVAEIVAMQRSGKVGGESIRQDYGRGRQLVALGAYTQGEVDSKLRGAETTYYHTPWEMAADAMGIYMHSPNVAKQQMPKTARLVQIAFRDNPTIQFFSMPFASVVAIVLANMLVAEGEEQEEEQMEPGALSMQPGALTA